MLPEVSVGLSVARDEAVSFDGLRTSSSWDTEWAVGLRCVWRRPPDVSREATAVRAARHRVEVAEQVARLWAARARVLPAPTLADRVHAALRLAEIDARLAALEPVPE